MPNDYLKWATAYLGVPYEMGGHWFGGRESTIYTGGTYTYLGYGIDCSGLVCNAAKWAGYSWAQVNWPHWDLTTDGLVKVSTQITTDQIQPGDILNKVNAHVVIVISKDGDTVEIIESAGTFKDETDDNKVRIRERNIKEDYKGYVPRRLNH